LQGYPKMSIKFFREGCKEGLNNEKELDLEVCRIQ
jgi:hypothetical protein